MPQSPSTVVGRGSEFELWKAGYYTVVHFASQDLTVLWDRKTTVHIRAGPQWKVGTAFRVAVIRLTTKHDVSCVFPPGPAQWIVWKL